MTRIWDDYLTAQDQEVLAHSGYGRRSGFGMRPALFIIDVQYNFVGDEPAPILEAIKTYRTACGENGWVAARHIQRLMEICRARQLPIFYTVAAKRSDDLDYGVTKGKNYRADEPTTRIDTHATEVLDMIKPGPKDFQVVKTAASALFGTGVMSQLNLMDVDTVIITGTTTSGCVRATAVDAAAYNFNVVVPEEAVFDRFEASHAMSLFDLNAKYADVIPVDETATYLESCQANARLAGH